LCGSQSSYRSQNDYKGWPSEAAFKLGKRIILMQSVEKLLNDNFLITYFSMEEGRAVFSRIAIVPDQAFIYDVMVLPRT